MMLWREPLAFIMSVHTATSAWPVSLCPGAACDHLSPLCLQEADRQCLGKSCSPGVDLIAE